MPDDSERLRHPFHPAYWGGACGENRCTVESSTCSYPRFEDCNADADKRWRPDQVDGVGFDPMRIAPVDKNRTIAHVSQGDRRVPLFSCRYIETDR